MLFSRREALRIYTSSSLFLNARAWTLASSSSRYLSCNHNILSYEHSSSGSSSSSSRRSSTSSWSSSTSRSRSISTSEAATAAVLCTSSGLASRTTAVVVGGSRQQAWPAPPVPSARRATTLVMGPVHVAAGVTDKIASIRGALRDTSSQGQGQGRGNAADGLQVIMDFDLTMTAPGSEQCHHMFETSSALPSELRARLAPFFNGKVEVSSREEWWDKFHEVLIGDRLTKEQVSLVARGADVTLRSGTSELMVLLHQLGVPLLIVSAGISDIVEESLRLRGLLLDNVTVRANTMLFDKHGNLESFRESPPVHSRNKQQTAEREKEYFDAHPGRRCIVLVGDKPGDADVNHGVAPDDRCLKIGFFDHSHEHPHPDLPPLPPPLAPPPLASPVASPLTPPLTPPLAQVPPASAAFGSGSVAAAAAAAVPAASAAAALEAGSVAAAGAGGGAGEGSFWATPTRFAGRPGSQGGGEMLVSSFSVSSSSSSVGTGDGGGGAGSGRVSVIRWLTASEEATPVQSILAERVRSVVPGSCAPAINDDGTSSNGSSDYVRQAVGEAGLGAGGRGQGQSQGSERSASAASVGMESVEAEEMLRAYGESFDIVACGGHPMDIVTDFVRHFAWLDDAGAD